MSRPPNFNGLAGLYRWMEFFSFGPWLALTRRTFLGELTDCKRALVLGDGDGRFSASLLDANPAIRLEAVDGSGAMLEALVRRAGRNAARVRTEQIDIREWQAPARAQEFGPPYDLIVTHFFLDCLIESEVRALAGKVREASSAQAVWVISEFRVPQGWFGRWIARPLVASLYLLFGLLTGLQVRRLPDYAAALREAGFTRTKQGTRLGGLLVSQLWTVTTILE